MMVKEIAKYIIIVLVSIILIFFGYIFVSINVLGNDYVNIFGYTYFLVGSGSMSPTIMKDDAVIVKVNSSYNKNDIVTYKLGRSYVTHRIIDMDNNNIILRGDANNIGDNIINKNRIIGKVVFVVKSIGLWKRVISNNVIVITFVVTVILFCLLYSYRDKIVRYRMRKVHYKVTKKKRKLRKKKGK